MEGLLIGLCIFFNLKLLNQIQVNVDVHDPTERRIVHQVPKLYSMGQSVVIKSTLPNALYYEIALSGFENIWQAYKLNIKASTCRTRTNQAVITFSVPWSSEDSHAYVV